VENQHSVAKFRIQLFHSVKNETLRGAWDPSPVEDKYLSLRETLLMMPGVLRQFRRSFLAAGRLNFPDFPRPKEHFLQWDDHLMGQRWAGALHLLKMAIRLYLQRTYSLAELNDARVGQPTTYRIPASARGALAGFGRKVLRLKLSRGPWVSWIHVTEAQLRYLYYRRQIQSLVGESFASVLEIGGGHGGLAAELLQHLPIGKYFIVELPEALPLAYFYLRACFDCPIQVLYRAEDVVDPAARIVILAPWKLQELGGEVDLLINTMSFQHMMPESLEFYLRQTDRLKAKHLYMVNRDTKRDPTDLIISEYPIPGAYRKTYCKPWLFGPHLEVVWARE
jgi:hypothetical protein